MLHTRSLLVLGLALSLGACATTPERAGSEPARPPSARAARAALGSTDGPPMVVDDSIGSRWEYLRNKYDGDGDGSIGASEYDRGETAFERLDRDGDGRITEEDFGASRDRPSRDERMARSRARRFLARYFQDDGDAGRFTRAELEAALAVYDTTGDGAVDREEFLCGAEERRQELPGDDSRIVERYMGDVEPWEGLRVVMDADGDGRLARPDVLAYFDANDSEGVIAFSSSDRGDARGAGRGEREKTGPTVGSTAPDFTLQSPEGEETVTLSSFAGERPVALIFGSYT